jgi:DNA-binding transcriptional ArsR family regulator
MKKEVLTSNINIKKLETAADILKTIAHPMRMAMISLLEGGKKMSVSEIHESLKIEQAVASHHLGLLKNKGILICQRNGKNCFYSLKHEQLIDIISCIDKCQS